MFFGKRMAKLEERLDAVMTENTNLRTELSKLSAENLQLARQNDVLQQNIRILKQYENLFNYDGTQQKNNLDGGGE